MEVFVKGRVSPDMTVVTSAEDTTLTIPAATNHIEIQNFSSQPIWYSFTGLADSWVKLGRQEGVARILTTGSPTFYLRKPYEPRHCDINTNPIPVALEALYTTAMQKRNADSIVKLEVRFI